MRNVQLLMVLLGLVFMTGLATAQEDLGAVKARMTGRVEAIGKLKAQKLVGENNQGLLTVLAKAAFAGQELVPAENADRTTVYKAIAASTGASADAVGKQRAEQIRQQAASGVMVQDAAGNWAAKP